MKPVSPAIALSLFASLLPASQVSALPFEPDYPCYMQTRSGQILNLAGVCAGKTIAVLAAPSAPLSTQVSSARQQTTTKQAANRGQVVEVKREIKDGGNGTWFLSGQVQNQTQQSISGLLLTLDIQSGTELITQNTRIAETTLAPGGYGSFQTTVTVRDHRPDFHVVSVHWSNQDGTSGNFP